MIPSTGARLRPKLKQLYRRCRCYTCLAHPDHAAILRRPTTSQASLFSWSVTSAFYSSIICTGAVLDVRNKQKRRQQLDETILETEQQLEDARKSQVERLEALGVSIDDVQLKEAVAAPQRRRAYVKRDTSDEHKAAPVEEELAAQNGRGNRDKMVKIAAAEVRALLSEDLEDAAMGFWFEPRDKTELLFSPNSIYRPSSRPPTYKPTPKKRMLSEYAAAELALKIRLETSSPSSEDYETVKQTLEKVVADLKLLKTGDTWDIQNTPRLDYPRYGSRDTDVDVTIDDFTRANRRLIQSFSRGNLSRADLGRKLSHNILASPVSPGRNGYTNLIRFLSRAEEFKLADFVIWAMSVACVRHDELSVGTMLSHHVRAGHSRSFVKLHEIMQGQHGGLMLAVGDQEPNDGQSPNRHWTTETEDGKLAMKIVWNGHIWRTLFNGYLQFGNVDKALGIHEQMSAAGHDLDMESLTRMMDHHNKHQDYAATMAIWDNLRGSLLPAKPHERILQGSPAHFAFRFALKACQESNLQTQYSRILREGLSRGLQRPALLLDDLPRKWALPSYTTHLQTRVHIVQEQAAAIEAACNRYSLFAMTSRMRLKGASLERVVGILESIEDEESAQMAWEQIGYNDPLAYRDDTRHGSTTGQFAPRDSPGDSDGGAVDTHFEPRKSQDEQREPPMRLTRSSYDQSRVWEPVHA